MDWLTKLFGNKEVMRDVKTTFSIIIALGIGLLYFGLFDTINISSLLKMKSIGLGVVSFISIWVIKVDIKDRAFNEEKEQNDELANVEIDMLDKEKQITDDDICLEFVNKYNKDNQDRANLLKTQKEIVKLNNRIRKKKIKGKTDYTKFEDKIAVLNSNPLYDKSYKNILPKDLMTSNGTELSKDDKGGRASIHANPKTIGNLKSFLMFPLKLFGFGGTGTLPFLISDKWETIAIYYGVLITVMVYTIISQYAKVRLLTATVYLDARKNKLRLIDRLINFTSKRLKEISDNKHVESVTEPQNEDKGGLI